MDWQFGTKPWGTILGTVCGVLLGSFRIRLILKKLEQQDRMKRRFDPEPEAMKVVWLAVVTLVGDRDFRPRGHGCNGTETIGCRVYLAVVICLVPALATMQLVRGFEHRSAASSRLEPCSLLRSFASWS